MDKAGHWGAALILYAPVGAALLARELVAAALVGGLGVLALARLPDLDLRIPLVEHRGPTHSLWFALLVGLALGGLAFGITAKLGRAEALRYGGFAFGVGVLSILSHVLADALTPLGCPLFWPVSGKTYSLRVTSADDGLVNYALLVLGVVVTVAVLVPTTGLSLPAGP